MLRFRTALYALLFLLYLFSTFVLLPKGVLYLASLRPKKTKPNLPYYSPRPSSIIPTPHPTPRLIPVTIAIPSLDLTTNIESVGLTDSGSMDVPKNSTDVAWYQYGPIPGEEGNAVIDGHYDTPMGRPAVFYRLKDMQLGDTVRVTFDNKSVVNFIVTDKQDIPDDVNPDTNTEYIFSKKPGTNLNLITCDGIWNPVTKRYSERIVIYTSLI